MNPSLRTRLFAVHGLAILAAIALLVTIARIEQRRWIVKRDSETLERAARLVAHDFTDHPLPTDWNSRAHVLGSAFGNRVTLIDRAGRVIGDSDVPSEELPAVENHSGRPEVRAALAGRVGRDLRHSSTVRRDMLYVAIPVAVGPLAVVRLSEALTVVSQLTGSLVRASAIAAAAALVLGLVMVYWLTGRHVRRVGDLERVAERIGAGDPARARELPADELGRLGRAINLMAAELRSRLGTLERERDEREQILAHMKDGVALLDRTGHVVRVNRSFVELLGSGAQATAGAPLSNLVRHPELDELVRSARRQRRTVEAELRSWKTNTRLIRASATPLGSGGENAVLIVLRDLTEIELVNRVRQDFVANVSHELRTPVTSLRGYAETLLEGGLDDGARREEFVRIIRDQAVRLGVLVEDLLTLSSLERPGASLKLEAFDLRRLVEAQVETFRPRITQPDLRLELEPGEPVEIAADRARIDQVIANLLENALKYTERGRVTVRLGGDGKRAWCEVEDTGAGIPEEDLTRIFERFYRVDKARSRDKGGTGLGLSIVKHIVSLHGGDISVKSRLGAGSTFRVELPRNADRPLGA